MRFVSLALGLSVFVAGCGSAIGAFDDLPPGSDLGDVPFPRLVDTPNPPEARLTAGTGERALTRLTSTQTAVTARRVRDDAQVVDFGGLEQRGELVRARSTDSPPDIDEAALLARAERLRLATEQPAPETDGADLLARAERVRLATARPAPQVTPSIRRPVPLRPLDQSPVSSAFEERARLARERARQAGS